MIRGATVWFAVLMVTIQLAAQKNVAERYLLIAANQEREALGIAPLAWDDALATAAAEHDLTQAAERSISHRFAGEAELAERGAAAGARFSLIAENVAEAPTARSIHEAWMRSQEHRANLLDPKLDAVGIAVVARGGQLYAVEDFAHTTVRLSLERQEQAVGALVEGLGLRLSDAVSAARATCALDEGYAGTRRPWLTLRYTAGTLDRLPEEFLQRIQSGAYRTAAVGACEDQEQRPFTAYRIAILLYR